MGQNKLKKWVGKVLKSDKFQKGSTLKKSTDRRGWFLRLGSKWVTHVEAVVVVKRLKRVSLALLSWWEFLKKVGGKLMENGVCRSWEVVVERQEVWKRGGNLFWINVEKKWAFYWILGKSVWKVAWKWEFESVLRWNRRVLRRRKVLF